MEGEPNFAPECVWIDDRVLWQNGTFNTDTHEEVRFCDYSILLKIAGYRRTVYQPIMFVHWAVR